MHRNRDQGWHPQDILAAVRKRGLTLTSLARDEGFARGTLHKALSQRYPNAHSIIASAIGRARHELWPQWYGPNDVPLLRSRRDLQRRSISRGAP